MVDIPSRMRIRRGTAAQAASYNPVLAEGEMSHESDTGILKVGDGVTAYLSLPIEGTFLLARNNAWIGVNTFAGVTTFTDDVTITADDSLFMGSSQEVEVIYSTAGDKWIARAKAAATWLSQRFSNFEIVNFNNTKAFIRGIVDAQVELFFNGVKKFETLVGGAKVTGDLIADTASGNWISALADLTAGTNNSKIVTPLVAAAFANNNPASFAGNGYLGIRVTATIKLYLQWGRYSLGAAAGAGQTVNFPIAFPATALGVWVGVDGAASQMIGTSSINQVGMAITKGSGDATARYGWFYAIGY